MPHINPLVTVGIILAFVGLTWVALVCTAEQREPIGPSSFNIVLYGTPGFIFMLIGICIAFFG